MLIQVFFSEIPFHIACHRSIYRNSQSRIQLLKRNFILYLGEHFGHTIASENQQTPKSHFEKVEIVGIDNKFTELSYGSCFFFVWIGPAGDKSEFYDGN